MRKIEEKYSDSLVVIGVHSAKFDGEKKTNNLRDAVVRHDIAHAVVNDSKFDIWNSYSVRAWPTLMFIDPLGKVIGRHEGEFTSEGLDGVVGQMIDHFDQVGLLRRKIETGLDIAKSNDEIILFPGKIEWDAVYKRLFIADSNHHRLIITNEEGEIQTIVGNGIAGNFDGDFNQSVFDNPQGMSVHKELVYVADAGTHTVKRVDIKAHHVESIAGTGVQGFKPSEGGDGLSVSLNSPYDVSISNGMLYIAMAGFHQIWSLNIDTHIVEPFAGSGVENLRDGLRMESNLAQPFGLHVEGSNVFFADSETSAIRVAKTGKNGRVVTLTGKGLFEWGDNDGVGPSAKLQHVEGLTMGLDVIFIADTYNHKIKEMDLSSLTVKTIAGTGEVGFEDGPCESASFNEPAGVAWSGEMLYVADKNNHAIRCIDLKQRKVKTINITGVNL